MGGHSIQRSKDMAGQKKNPFSRLFGKAVKAISNVLSKAFKYSKNSKPEETKEPVTDYQRHISTANLINNALTFASKNRDYLEKYGMLIEPLTKEILGNDSYIPEAGDKNQYFEIDENYNGDIRTLFSHITFKDIPETEDTKAYAEAIMNQPWSTEESLKAYEEAWHHRSYLKNLEDESLKGIPFETLEALEFIMNSSAAWYMAGAGFYESNQVKDNWTEMYNAVNEAKESGNYRLYSVVVQMLENGIGNYKTVTSYVDDEIMKMRKG